MERVIIVLQPYSLSKPFLGLSQKMSFLWLKEGQTVKTPETRTLFVVLSLLLGETPEK